MRRYTVSVLMLLLFGGPSLALAQDAQGEAEAGAEAEAEVGVGADLDADLGLGGEAGGTAGAEGAAETAPPPEPAGGYAEAEAPPAEAGVETGAEVGADANAPGPLVLGLEVGGAFPQPFTELDAHFRVGLEVGFKLPFASERIELFLSAGYTPPNNEFSDGPYDAQIVQKELTFGLGPRVRFLPVESMFNVTLAAGARLFLLETTSNGDADGEAFAEFTEQSTQIGFFGAVGGEVVLGPGAAFLDIDLGWSDLPHEITGDVSTGNLALTVGYRFMLL